jgi:hypothetical protein
MLTGADCEQEQLASCSGKDPLRTVAPSLLTSDFLLLTFATLITRIPRWQLKTGN